MDIDINAKIEEIGRFANLELFNIPESIAMFGLGLAVLLFGYRIKKIAFFIVWFLLGFYATNMLMPYINENISEISSNDLMQFLLPIGGGLLLALMGFSIEKICVGGICFALVLLITAQYFGTEMITMAIGGVIGVILAGVAVMMMKPAIIIATAIAGGYAITIGILALDLELDMTQYFWPLLIVISAIGAFFQFKTTKRVR